MTDEDPFDDLDDDEVEPFGTPRDEIDEHQVPVEHQVSDKHHLSDENAPDDVDTLPTSKMEAWRRRSASGAILSGIALGLQQVFEPKRDEPAIVIETSGDPPDDLPVEAEFEFRRPRQSVVSIRPWLIATNEQGDDHPSGPPDAPRPESSDGSGPG